MLQLNEDERDFWQAAYVEVLIDHADNRAEEWADAAVRHYRDRVPSPFPSASEYVAARATAGGLTALEVTALQVTEDLARGSSQVLILGCGAGYRVNAHLPDDSWQRTYCAAGPDEQPSTRPADDSNEPSVGPSQLKADLAHALDQAERGWAYKIRQELLVRALELAVEACDEKPVEAQAETTSPCR